MFNLLNISKEWNIPQKHHIEACFNCGDPDHGIPKCPKAVILLTDTPMRKYTDKQSRTFFFGWCLLYFCSFVVFFFAKQINRYADKSHSHA